MNHKINKWALVTGASTGIGYEIASQLAMLGYNLILVSQNKKRLSDASKKISTLVKNKGLKIKLIELPVDLSKPSSPALIYKKIKAKRIFIHTLVNNAGIGLAGDFNNQNYKIINDMLHINIIALVKLTQLFLADMLNQKKGAILNVSSVAGFLPGPLMAVYYASKAFVSSFSQALNQEVFNKGIHVSALCPGPVNTPFHQRSNTKKRRYLSSPYLKLSFKSSKFVAKAGIRGLEKNKALIIPGINNTIMIFILCFIPRKFIRRFIYFINKTI